MRKLLLLVVLFQGSIALKAQQPATDVPAPVQKKEYRYLGIQANLLIQQFISFNSNASINTNPYIFSYSKNDIKTGVGFVFGTGLNVNENSSNDGVSAVNVRNANVTFRIGYEKKYFQDQKFIPFWGIDFGIGGVYNRVESSLNQSFNTATTVSETTKLFMGPAFRAGLCYTLSKHILLGTEFFFNAQVAYSETRTNTGFNSGGFQSDFVPFNIGFQAPTALFLIFRY